MGKLAQLFGRQLESERRRQMTRHQDFRLGRDRLRECLHQSLWVVLLPFGGLGMGGGHLPRAAREWLRIFSWPMIYLLVMQLKGKIHPKVMINSIFLSLVAPLTAAVMQTFLPPSMLPAILMPIELGGIEEGASRIGGTFGHPNGFAIYSVLFICLTFWKVSHSSNPKKWLPLFGEY